MGELQFCYLSQKLANFKLIALRRELDSGSFFRQSWGRFLQKDVIYIKRCDRTNGDNTGLPNAKAAESGTSRRSQSGTNLRKK